MSWVERGLVFSFRLTSRELYPLEVDSIKTEAATQCRNVWRDSRNRVKRSKNGPNIDTRQRDLVSVMPPVLDQATIEISRSLVTRSCIQLRSWMDIGLVSVEIPPPGGYQKSVTALITAEGRTVRAL